VIVKATREGLIGQRTASGYVIDSVVPFVALPAEKAIGRFVRLSNPATRKACYAIVLDVGPWNINDDPYVFAGHRPEAETGTDSTGRTTNGAGIDLGQKVWSELGMTDNGPVDWEFL
jgi:hypothetical protein